MPVMLVFCKFCDFDIQHLFGFISEYQSHSLWCFWFACGQFTLQEEQQFLSLHVVRMHASPYKKFSKGLLNLTAST